jgi:hypothetical protein
MPAPDSEVSKRHGKRHDVLFVILHLLAILILGLMCGSELNVGAFGHPTLNQVLFKPDLIRKRL